MAPDTLKQAFFRWLSGQVAVYLPAPTDVSNLEQTVTEIAAAIGELKTAVAAAATRVTALEANLSTPADVQDVKDATASVNAIAPGTGTPATDTTGPPGTEIPPA